jgi:stage V sporulation protein AB
MFLKTFALIFAGLSAGGMIAAGIFAFLAMIGVFPRLIGVCGTGKHILLCETAIILGGVCGNFVDLYHFRIPFGGLLLLLIFGLFSGIFVGCLAMSLAETLKALPIFCRRTGFSVGIQYVILGVAAGKLTGALIYFFKGFGGT